jgi:hypothetical protein
MPYTVQAIPDHKPSVEIKKPGEDVTLPVNGLLKLEGTATDDIGVAAVTLKMASGGPVKPKPYRDGKSFRLGTAVIRPCWSTGTCRAGKGHGCGRQAGGARRRVIEYWLEAADGCDYPAANTAESKHYKVIIAEAAAGQTAAGPSAAAGQQEQRQPRQSKTRNRPRERRPQGRRQPAQGKQPTVAGTEGRGEQAGGRRQGEKAEEQSAARN